MATKHRMATPNELCKLIDMSYYKTRRRLRLLSVPYVQFGRAEYYNMVDALTALENCSEVLL